MWAVLLTFLAIRHRRRIAREAGRVAVNAAADAIRAKRAIATGMDSFRQRAVDKADGG